MEGKGMKLRSIDATQGSLVRSIFIYAIPLFLTTLMQQLFNAVDIAVLGNMADTSAVASVGATGPITSLLVNTFVAFATATKVILARLIGAREKERITHSVNMAVILPIMIGIFSAIFGWFLAPQILAWTDCPRECVDGALIYLRLYISAAPFILFYNFGSSVISASGDTGRPLIYMIASGLLNVVLNILLCIILPQKVVAVAVATVASHMLGAVLVFIRMTRMEGMCRLVLSKIRWNTQAFSSVIRYGIPLMITSALYPISNLQIQSAVNFIGVAAIAGNSAGATLESLIAGINSAFAATVTAFMGQNIGARQYDRVKKSFFYCILFSVIITLIVSTSMLLTKDFWLRFILTDDHAAYEFAYIRMYCVLAIYAVASANGCIAHAIQAFGYPIFSSSISIISIFGFRMIWMQFIYPIFEPSFFHLVFCYTVSWTLHLLLNIGGFIFYYRRFLKGKYKKRI